MKQYLILTLLVVTNLSFAEDVKVTKDAKTEWNATSLTDETIKKIQQAQYQYKKCVSDEMQKTGYGKIETRSATEAITKQCEKELAKMRQVYLDVKVPGIVADRHLKKMRIEMTRRVLKQLMFAKAARNSK